jgi:phenylpropionate dioxygenase-like ring-hydroxylating dioxygenase large terminal subunit
VEGPALHRGRRLPRHGRWQTPLLAASLVLAACASPSTATVAPGDTAAAVRQRLGPATAEHSLPDGGRRLEYSGGRYGRFTLMVDTDAEGRVVAAQNVRDEAHFNRIQPGITHEELRRQLGEPSRVWRVRYHDQTVWTYRFDGRFCLVFHVGLTPQGVVEDTSYGPDAGCEERPGRLSGR